MLISTCTDNFLPWLVFVHANKILSEGNNLIGKLIMGGRKVCLQLLNFFVCFKLTCGTLCVTCEIPQTFREVVVPQLHSKPNFHELFFQQDGTPLHYALRVRDCLNKVFPQHWFGRRGSIE